MTRLAAGHRVCHVDDLPPGATVEVKVAGRSIGVLNVDGKLYAIRNACPHQGAPLCRGAIAGTMLPSRPQEWVYGMDRQILRCPWHGWEFDLATGRSLFDPAGVRVKTYDVEVVGDEIMLALGSRAGNAAKPTAARPRAAQPAQAARPPRSGGR